jgi:hypothetical protein
MAMVLSAGAAANTGRAGIDQTITLSLAAGVADGGPAAYRYYRFDEITVTSLLEVNEWAIVNDGTYVSGGTWTESAAAIDMLVSSRMTDGILTVGAGFRAMQITGATGSGFLQYDHGSPVVATGFRYALFFSASTRAVTGFRIRGSNDNVTYTTIGTRSGLTSPFTADGQLSAEIKFVP